MRLSSLIGKTLRQPPSDAHLPSHQLLVRAGYVRAMQTGLFAYLPLGWSVLTFNLLRYPILSHCLPLSPAGFPAMTARGWISS